MGWVDFHTHAFPDFLAPRAIPLLEEKGGIKAKLDGKISSLLKSMDEAGIEISVVCSIATRPEQFTSILEWSKDIRSPRIIPLPSFHPQDKEVKEKIEIIKKEGFKGIKLHPYYQDFYVDEEHMFPIYEKIEEEGLLLVLHTGFDFAFPRERRADPEKILKVCKKFPSLKLITTHLGGWEDWEEVACHLLGKEIYMETSFSLKYLGREKVKEFLLKHPSDYLLFGTDSPWSDQKEEVEEISKLELPQKIFRKIMGENALKLLQITPSPS